MLIRKDGPASPNEETINAEHCEQTGFRPGDIIILDLRGPLVEVQRPGRNGELATQLYFEGYDSDMKLTHGSRYFTSASNSRSALPFLLHGTPFTPVKLSHDSLTERWVLTEKHILNKGGVYFGQYTVVLVEDANITYLPVGEGLTLEGMNVTVKDGHVESFKGFIQFNVTPDPTDDIGFYFAHHHIKRVLDAYGTVLWEKK